MSLLRFSRTHSAGGVDANAITFEPCCRFVNEWMTASEPEIARAMIGALEQDNERLEGVAAVRCRSTLLQQAH